MLGPPPQTIISVPVQIALWPERADGTLLPVEVADQPGALQAVVECLAKNNINLDNTSGFVANQHAVVLIETQDTERAKALLIQQGLRVLSGEELLGV